MGKSPNFYKYLLGESMNSAQMHLLLTHVPVLLVIFSLVLLAIGIVRHNTTLARTALSGFIISALMSIAVFNTGEGAEDVVENLVGVGKTFIETHEDAAKTSMIVVQILGIFSIAGLWFMAKKQEIARFALFGIFALSVVSAASFAYTAHLGGMIRHTEIRPNAQVGGTMEGGAVQNGEMQKKKHDDDDDD